MRRGLGLENFVLHGQSWSSMLAIEYALRYPQHLRGLVISNMTAGIQAYQKRAAAIKSPLRMRESPLQPRTALHYAAVSDNGRCGYVAGPVPG